MKKVLISIVTSLFVLCGCQVIQNVIQPVATPAPGGTLLLSDEFNDNSNHWGTSSNSTGSIALNYQGLDIKVDQANSLLWSVAGEKFADSRIEVDGVLLGGPDDDVFGAVCRFQDKDHFYGFLISHDGYYGIFKMNDGNLTLANAEEGLKFSEAIRQGGTVNHITAICQGNQLKLAVNDTLLSIVQDDDYSAGQIGLIAGTYANGGSDIFFDNLQVFQP